MAGSTANWRLRTTCRLCGSDRVRLVCEFAPMPIATTNFNTASVPPDSALFREAVPMNWHICEACGFLQILVVGNAELQYRDYIYTTSLSLGLPQHFQDAATHLIRKLDLPRGSRVFELGSNDGTYLRAFQAKDMNVVGIDPARSIARAATERGVPTYSEFFGQALAKRLIEERGFADLLLANNVIANVDDLADLFKGVGELLAPEGVFAFETQYGLDVTEGMLIDTIYHEHLSYFNVAPLVEALPQYGLALFHVERLPTKGGSIRAYVKRSDSRRPVSVSVRDLLALETQLGVQEVSYYETFATRLSVLRERIMAMVRESRASGQPLAGYGVSVGTSTMLAQFGLTGAIDFLVDDDPAKPAVLRGPGYDIPVRRPEDLLKSSAALAVIFAWRYEAPIVNRSKSYTDAGGRFLVPLPEPKII